MKHFKFQPAAIAVPEKGEQRGTIKSFSATNGYGFVFIDNRPLAEDALFFHVTDVAAGDAIHLSRGRRIAFEVGQRDGRHRAVNVRLI